MTPKTRSASPVYLDAPAAADQFLHSISSTRQLAVDTEGASFHRFVDRIYLLQLSTRDVHAIIDPLAVTSPTGLGTLLESRDVEVVFHDADYDLRLLHQDYGWKVTNIFDTRVAAQLLGVKAFGLAALLAEHFQVKLDKKHQRADWSMRPLPAEMLDYAAQDTLNLLALRDQLHGQLVQKQSWHWAQEEFARLEGTMWEADEPATAFMRIKGARDLSRRELALLKELVAWREMIARELDRSTFRVVANDVLFDLARKVPTRKADLTGMRGLNPRLIDQRGTDLLAAIDRGQQVPESDLPRYPKSARWDRDPNFEERVARLRTVRDAAAKRLDLDPGVLCARDRMEAVARQNPTSVEQVSALPAA